MEEEQNISQKAEAVAKEGNAQASTASDASSGDATEANNDSSTEDGSFKAEIAKLQEDLKRAQAETINTAKRMNAEIQKEYQRGIEHVLSGIPDIMDSLERANESNTDDQQSIRDGVAITLSKFAGLLYNHGFETIEPQVGDRLDPQVHQAISLEHSEEFGENRVLRLAVKGYRHGSRVLRPASVVASSPRKQDDKGDDQTSNGEEK